jgi:hypothetical protein
LPTNILFHFASTEARIQAIYCSFAARSRAGKPQKGTSCEVLPPSSPSTTVVAIAFLTALDWSGYRLQHANNGLSRTDEVRLSWSLTGQRDLRNTCGASMRDIYKHRKDSRNSADDELGCCPSFSSGLAIMGPCGPRKCRLSDLLRPFRSDCAVTFVTVDSWELSLATLMKMKEFRRRSLWRMQQLLERSTPVQ